MGGEGQTIIIIPTIPYINTTIMKRKRLKRRNVQIENGWEERKRVSNQHSDKFHQSILHHPTSWTHQGGTPPPYHSPNQHLLTLLQVGLYGMK